MPHHSPYAARSTPAQTSLDEMQLEIAFAVAEIFERHKVSCFYPSPQKALTPREHFLKGWRDARAKVEGVRHCRLFSNRTLVEIAARDPNTLAELVLIHGIGAKKLEAFGQSLIDALANFRKLEKRPVEINC